MGSSRSVPDSSPKPFHPPPPLRVLRLGSVFETPDLALDGEAARFDPVGGMQNHMGYLTRELDQRGVHQIVVTSRPPGAPRLDRLGSHGVVMRYGLPIRPLRQLYSVPAAAAMMQHGADADLVHAHLGEDLAAMPIAVACARRHRLPLVITVHASSRFTLKVGNARSAVLKVMGGRLEKWAAEQADAVIGLTPRLATLMVDHGLPADRVHVIPSGVVPAEFVGRRADPWPHIEHPRVVFLGRLAHQKGVRTLVAAASRLQTPNVQVVLVGDGPERAALEELVRAEGIGERVHFMGFQPHDVVPAVLAHADLMVFPSVYEELGTALLEGLQAGLPIVASRVGGVPDAVGSAAVLVPPSDPAALSTAVDRLLADPAERKRLSALARERARAFDWGGLADRVLDVYRHAIAHRGDGPVPLASARSEPPPPEQLILES